MINRYLREGLLELALVAPNGTMTEFSRAECEHRTIHAPLLNPAEGVRVEPFEPGQYFARLAKSTSAAEPPPSLTAQPDESAIADPAPASASAADVEDRAGAANPSQSPQAQRQPQRQPQPQPPKPASADTRASRRRRNWESGAGSGAQTLRARVVLKRLYGSPAKYPTREEVPDADLYDRFAEEYKKVEGKAKPSSKWGMPSRATVLREVGRQVD